MRKLIMVGSGLESITLLLANIQAIREAVIIFIKVN